MMTSTSGVFEDRKTEIEFYYSVMVDMENKPEVILHTIDNQRFFRIMKSNFLLMLYNLVEATFTTGMDEIYDQVNTDKCTYNNLIDEIQTLWRDYKVKEIYGPTSDLKGYTSRVQLIVNDITHNVPLSLTRGMRKFSGNLNAKKIKEICDKHKIRYCVSDDNAILEKVKMKRNSLAHGDESFSRCARDLTLSDLEIIKDAVFQFISDIITGMDKYYTEKQYLRENQT